MKFAVSIALAGAATSWLRHRLPRRRRIERATAAIVAALVVEQVLISVQAARGVRSHFNDATALDATVFRLMGVFVMVAFVGLLLLAMEAQRTSTGDRVVDAVARWGSWLVVGGAAVGFGLVAADGHTIGAADGGPGLPLVGWSTGFGDLRPAHFVGLHGLQALIVLAAVAGRQGWSSARTLAAVRAAATGIAVLAAALVLQAVARFPVTSPSSLAVVAATGAAAAWGWRRGGGRIAAAPAGAELTSAR